MSDSVIRPPEFAATPVHEQPYLRNTQGYDNVIILPVIRVERHGDADAAPVRQKR